MEDKRIAIDLAKEFIKHGMGRCLENSRYDINALNRAKLELAMERSDETVRSKTNTNG